MLKRGWATLLAMMFVWMGQAQNTGDWAEMMQDPSVNFYDVQAAFEAYFSAETVEKGKGFKQYKRWEAFMEPRVYPTGERPDPSILGQAYSQSQQNSGPTAGQWQALGPFNGNSINGIGRVNRLAFHPTNPNVIFACTAAGGLWKTTDNGATWSTNTDLLPNLGTSDLAINPKDTNIMYLATGDRDGGDTYSFGLLKSTNGGQSWNTTGLVFNVPSGVRISDVYLNPLHPDTLIVSTRNGIYRSTDGAASFTMVQGGVFNEIVQKIGDTDVLFTSTLTTGSARIYRSVNGGITWSAISDNNLPTGGVRRIEIAVTPADDDYVYALMGANNNGFYGLYRSTDGGNTWTQRSNSPNLMGWSTTGNDSGGQAWYDLALAVDPNDKERIYTGGVNIWTSANGGSSWSLAAHWYGGGGAPYVHADIHDLDFSPSGQLWSGDDGGVHRKNLNNSGWVERNNGFNITQYYKIGSAANDTTKVIAGAQDNGTHLMAPTGTWNRVRGGDGMDCAIDPQNSNIMYNSVYYGDFRKSINGGASFNANFNLPPAGNGNWVTPFVIDPQHPDTLYAGFSRLWRSFNGGASFSAVSPSNLTGGANIDHITVAPGHSNVIYIAEGNGLWRSDDYGVNWFNLSNRVPGSRSITNIAVSHLDPYHIAISRSGYSNGQKVYSSLDGGSSWTNLSGSLPNIPANCLAMVEDFSGGIYVGTDIGVFYRDKNMSDWIPFNDGMPNVIVNELEINYLNGKIRAGTYGRGLYESPLYGAQSAPLAEFSVPFSVCLGDTIQLLDASSYTPTNWLWSISPNTFTFVNGTTANSQNPQIVLNQNGPYNISLRAGNANGTDSTFALSIMHAGGHMLPYSEDFEQTSAFKRWSAESSAANNRFRLLNATGNGGQSAPGVRFVNSSANGDEVDLISPLLDFSGHDSVWLDFDYAYTSFSNNQDDSLKLYIATGCSQNWVLLNAWGENGTSNFVTRSAQAAAFTPAQSGDWCGTPNYGDCKQIDLTAYANQIGIRLKFVAVDGGGNSIFIDNINISGVANAAPNAAFSSAQQVCANRSVQFVNQSSGSPTSYNWSFPGGTPATSSSPNPQITYNTPGTYNVQLIVENALGRDTLLQSAYVKVDPATTVSLQLSSAQGNTLCPGDTLFVNGNASNAGASPAYDWYLNGQLVGNTNSANFAYTGLQNGDELYAILRSSEACAFPLQAYSDTITANYHPTVSLSINMPSSSCENEAPVAISASPSGGVFSGPGVANGQFDPTVAGPGLHDVTYTYIASTGCVFSTTQSILVNALPQISMNESDYCEGEGSVYLNTAQPFGGVYSGPGVTNNYLNVDQLGPGTYTLYYSYTRPGCSQVTDSATYEIFPAPARPSLILQGDTLLVQSSGAVSYQWYSTSSIMPGFTNPYLVPSTSFTYYAVITDANGCTAVSDTFNYQIGLADMQLLESFELYPNPTSNVVHLELGLKSAKNLRAEIHALDGRVIRVRELGTAREFKQSFDLSQLPKGVYILHLSGDQFDLNKKLILQ